MAGEAGFEVKITVMEAATLLNRITNGNYEVSLLIWSGRADPDANISIWVACDGFVNYGKYCEPKLDDILRRARQTTDVAERKRLYAEAAAIYLPARPYLFLYHLKWFWGASAKLTGIVPHPDGIIRLQGLRLQLEQQRGNRIRPSRCGIDQRLGEHAMVKRGFKAWTDLERELFTSRWHAVSNLRARAHPTGAQPRIDLGQISYSLGVSN